MSVDSKVCIYEGDVGKSVFEITETKTFVNKYQIVADDPDSAFTIWLDQRSTNLKVEDGSNCISSYEKEYSELGSTVKIADILYDKDEDEVYCENK